MSLPSLISSLAARTSWMASSKILWLDSPRLLNLSATLLISRSTPWQASMISQRSTKIQNWLKFCKNTAKSHKFRNLTKVFVLHFLQIWLSQLIIFLRQIAGGRYWEREVALVLNSLLRLFSNQKTQSLEQTWQISRQKFLLNPKNSGNRRQSFWSSISKEQDRKKSYPQISKPSSWL